MPPNINSAGVSTRDAVIASAMSRQLKMESLET
jgi:hypothetical protein